MKNRLFKKNASVKSKTKKLIISIVTLVLVLSIAVTTAYAWVESISSVIIESSTNELKVVDSLLTNANINTSSTATIDLAKYFRTAGNVHLSEASSADGENIFFPVVTKAGTTTGTYRKANVNDKNVNYYDISFKIKPAQAFDFYFNSVPQFKINGSDRLSYLFCSISLDGNDPKLYSNIAQTNRSVIAGVDGTTSTITTQAFSDSVKPSSGTPDPTKAVFRIGDTNEHTVNIKFWLQRTYFATSGVPSTIYAPTNNGYSVLLNNFSLVPSPVTHTVTLTPVTDGTIQTSSATGGKVAKSGSTLTAGQVTYTVNHGTSVTLSASANTGYDFKGWATSSTASSGSTSVTLTVTDDVQYYAIFKIKTFTVSAYAYTVDKALNYTNSSTGGTVKVSSGTASSSASSTVNYNGSVTFTATVKSGYTFDGWFSTNTKTAKTTRLSASTSYTVSSVQAAQSIYARFRSNTRTLYYTNTNNWTVSSSMYCYYWKNGSSGSWPGSTMTYVETNTYGQKVYKYDYNTSSYDMVIFHNNSGSQTSDLSFSSFGDWNNCYYNTGYSYYE